METVRAVDVLACTLVDDGATDERTLVTPDVSVGMPRAALSSADLRMARLMCAVCVAGRKFGAGEEDTAGVLGVAGVCFLAGVTAVAADLETAWVVFLCVLGVSGLEEAFLVELDEGLVVEEAFLVVSAILVEVECFVSLTALATLSAAGLVLDDEGGLAVGDKDGLVLELLLTFGFDDEEGVATWCCLVVVVGGILFVDV